MPDFGLIDRDDAVLVVVDIQEKLFPLIQNKENILKESLKVIEFFKRLNLPIVVTEQYPKGLGETLPEVKEALGNLYRPITKTAFSCFGEPAFERQIHKLRKTWLVLIGIETHVCVAQTAIEGINSYDEKNETADFDIAVLADCVGSRTDFYHQMGLSRLRDEGALITTADAVFYELLGEAKTAEHKKVFDLLK